MYPQVAPDFPLLKFTSQYSAIQQYVPLDSTRLHFSAVYTAIQCYTKYVPLTSLDWNNRIHTSKRSRFTGHALCLSPRFIKYSMKTSASQRKYNICHRSHDSSDVKIQRSRVDYGLKFQTLKGGKHVLNYIKVHTATR